MKIFVGYHCHGMYGIYIIEQRGIRFQRVWFMWNMFGKAMSYSFVVAVALPLYFNILKWGYLRDLCFEKRFHNTFADRPDVIVDIINLNVAFLILSQWVPPINNEYMCPV